MCEKTAWTFPDHIQIAIQCKSFSSWLTVECVSVFGDGQVQEVRKKLWFLWRSTPEWDWTLRRMAVTSVQPNKADSVCAPKCEQVHACIPADMVKLPLIKWSEFATEIVNSVPMWFYLGAKHKMFKSLLSRRSVFIGSKYLSWACKTCPVIFFLKENHVGQSWSLSA